MATGAVQGAEPPSDPLARDALDRHPRAEISENPHRLVVATGLGKGRHQDAIGSEPEEITVALWNWLPIDCPRRRDRQAMNLDAGTGLLAP